MKLHPELLSKHQKFVQDKEKLEDSKPVFLVFHGGSGSSKDEFKQAISYGVVKVVCRSTQRIEDHTDKEEPRYGSSICLPYRYPRLRSEKKGVRRSQFRCFSGPFIELSLKKSCPIVCEIEELTPSYPQYLGWITIPDPTTATS